MESHLSNGVQKLQKYTETVMSGASNRLQKKPAASASNGNQSNLLLAGGAVALGLGVAVGAFMGWMGAFRSVSWGPSEIGDAFKDSYPSEEEETKEDRSRVILFLRYRGPYGRNIGEEFQKVAEIRSELLSAEQCGGSALENFAPLVGVFLDNPLETLPEDCRAIVGFSVPAGLALDVSKYPELEEAVLPLWPSYRATFPYRNSLSPLLAVRKVYKAIRDVEREHQGPVLEIYLRDRIEYHMVEDAEALLAIFE